MMPAIATLPCAPVTAAAPISPTLQDILFGAVPSLSSDLIKSQNTCSFSGVAPITYAVGAGGSGSGGAFTLTNGTSTIPYEVQWAQGINASSGTALTANVALNGQVTPGLLSGLTCALGATNASLIIIVRATSLQQATAGTYAGTLTVLMAAQ